MEDSAPDLEGKLEHLVVTGASEAYAPSLFALLGSLELNWPAHPRVIVYDLGLSEVTRAELKRYGVWTRAVPVFCPHWRRHFTWKFWCWNDAPARHVLWLDAGIVALQALDEVFVSTELLGYFVVPTHHLLTSTASPDACRACGVDPDFRTGRMTFAGGVIGFDKGGRVGNVLSEALQIAMDESSLRATAPSHRHDQALLSMLMHRDIERIVCSDGLMYQGWESPRQVPGQKLWVHRRSIRDHDLMHFSRHISTPGPIYFPSDPLGSFHPSVIPRGLRCLPRRIIRTARRVGRGSSRTAITPYDGVRD